MEDNFSIRGIFKREIYERFQTVIDLLEINGITRANGDITKTNFGLHYCSLIIRDKEKRDTFFGMLKSYEEYFKSISNKSNRVVIILPEPEYQKITVYEGKKKTLPKKVSFDEMIEFISKEREAYPNAIDVSCGTTYLTFKTPVRRLEDAKEFVARLQEEDRHYVEKYKRISKQLGEMEKLKEYME